jgi:hypothetical protein
MMTVRITTGQKDHLVCLSLLKLAYDTGVLDMRTKWFTITRSGGLRWKSLAIMEDILGRVVKGIVGRDDVSAEEFLFASYIGVKFNDEVPEEFHAETNRILANK